MALQYFTYTSADTAVPAYQRKPLLPDWVKARLLEKDGATQNEIIANAADAEIVAFLDEYFHIGRKKEYTRYCHIEATEDEIGAYDFFAIRPADIEFPRDVVGDTAEPSCPTGLCQRGARLLSPLCLRTKRATQNDMAVVTDWNASIILVLSAQLKTALEAMGVAGLTYEPCTIPTSGTPASAGSPPYTACLNTCTYHAADSIHIHSQCVKCTTILDYALHGVRLDREAILPSDFLAIDRVVIPGRIFGKTTYFYSRPHWIISRRVLQLLLGGSFRGLRPMGFFLGQRFLPVPVST